MSENEEKNQNQRHPYQFVFNTCEAVANCIQTHVYRFVGDAQQRFSPNSRRPLFSISSSLSATNVSDGDRVIQQSKTDKFVVVKSSKPVTKEELGRCTWTFLHTLAAQFPDRPTRQQKKDVKELMAILSRVYPCKDCADHFREVLRILTANVIIANPVQAGSQAEFSRWLCHVHNVVNRSLGKPIFPCQRIDARWGKLECQDRACDLEGSTGFSI
ncbi:hypothetical protein Sjap_022688 [Stephania japonica]|uniref:Sulfhydryl oxidase n=1 Tax=Stephania japonica TaxID=461633 RepID=A0AAP0EPC8_9MAGN